VDGVCGGGWWDGYWGLGVVLLVVAVVVVGCD
jgi:hypothetical protein